MFLKRCAFFLSLMILAAPSLARADFDASKAWFISLDPQVRYNTQANLVLAGDYDALVDGNFGPQTYQAIASYQSSQSQLVDGVLTATQMDQLSQHASFVFGRLGLKKVVDRQAGLVLFVPTNLTVNSHPLASGTAYVSLDGQVEIETLSNPRTSMSLGQVFSSRSAASLGQRVTYSTLGADSFVITGQKDGGFFYDRFYDDGASVVGFELRWTQGRKADGAVLATFMASFSYAASREVAEAAAPQAPFQTAAAPEASTTTRGGTSPAGETDVPLQSNGGTFVVPVLVNDAITLKFVIDSGAADVSIPADVFLTLMRTGSVTAADFLGKQTYTLADGSSVPSQTFVIHSLRVGDKILRNVTGSVASPNGMLLLGQSFLKNFSSWSIDNGRQMLVLGAVQPGDAQIQIGSDAADAVPVTSPSQPMPPGAPQSIGTEAERLALYGGLDFYGHDIFKGRTKDAVECAADCLQDRQCRAFTFNANPSIHSGPNCFLKGDVGHFEAYSTAIGGLLLAPGQSAPRYSFDAIDPTADLLRDHDFPGGDLSSYPDATARTLDSCRMACINNKSCAAFSFVSSVRQCWLKGAVNAGRFVPGVVSGNKRHVSVLPSDVFNVPR